MAVTIGLGPAAGSSGAGQSGVPAGLEAILAQSGGVLPEGAEGGSTSDPASNPFVAQLAAALKALQSGSTEGLQTAALILAGQDGQNLHKQFTDASLEASAGQDLPLDPSFSGAVLATFAAVQEMIRQHGTPEGQKAVEDGSMELADQFTTDQNANADLSLDASALAAAAAAAASGQAAGLVNASAISNSGQISDAVDTEGAEKAMGVSGLQAAITQQAQSATAGITEEQKAALVQAAKEAGQSAKDQSIADPAAQAAIAQAQAELLVSKTVDGATPARALQTVGVQKNTVSTAAKNASHEVSVDKLAQQLALDSGSDLESSAHVLEQAAGNASMVRHTENTALMQQGLDIAIGADASAKTGSARPEAANASQLEGASASIEARVEAARASLASGPLNVEVLRLTRQGGGRAVLEVTPPNQGPIRLDLQLDGSGRASLIVEGLSEALRTRLEGTAHFLRQDMAQMGLALNLEMRERNDSQAQQAAFGQGGFQSQREAERQPLENSLTSPSGSGLGSKTGLADSADKEGGVYLYA